MSTLLEPDARERREFHLPPLLVSFTLKRQRADPSSLSFPPSVSRINLTRPQLSRQVQSILLRMAQGGQLRGKVSDDQLVGLLEQAQGIQNGGSSGGGGGKIVVSRFDVSFLPSGGTSKLLWVQS